jgi:hypothetical protein
VTSACRCRHGSPCSRPASRRDRDDFGFISYGTAEAPSTREQQWIAELRNEVGRLTDENHLLRAERDRLRVELELLRAEEGS